MTRPYSERTAQEHEQVCRSMPFLPMFADSATGTEAAAKTQGQLVEEAEADRMAARQGYNPNR